ncbi:peptidyl-tRNA hydrolase [Corynebacterium sp. HS2168-gen11]|uniref:peptidyl-tRNA hydrolase n=1 Tax=Corynebacterium sp. HS2168-gen11 TaxID=2974027 RepID=UPI00216B600E|nr:peptidyl-tRNA hydrolase [Corynebacterium sp. HS2168-gen11]MCS4535278.1 ACR protein [Corynebacterium sp. HS2168-gen11]
MIPQEFATSHARLARAVADRSWTRGEDPDDPATIQAMQLVLHLPKDPTRIPPRSHVLIAAAQAVVTLCLEPQAGIPGEFQTRLETWYTHRIRKVARRARNKQWRDAQAVPGVTVHYQQASVRACVPSAVQDVPPVLRKLQIHGTDLPPDAVHSPLPEITAEVSVAPVVIVVDASLGMSVGKVAAQVGHASMLFAGQQSVEWCWRWQQAGFPLTVREIPHDQFVAKQTLPQAVVVRDAGFTEIAPNTATCVALLASDVLHA